MTDIERTAARSRRLWWVVLLAVLGNVLTLILAVVMVQHFNKVTERKFCAVLEVQSGTPVPPTTARAIAVLAAIQKLHRDLGCPNTGTVFPSPSVRPTPTR